MNNTNLMAILATTDMDRTPEQNDAVKAHERVVLDKQMVEVGLYNLCRDLKEIRDRRYYAVLGYEDFGAYTKDAHGIGGRQAYNYIGVYERFGAEFLNSNSKLGVTKLVAIASLTNDEREELMAEYSTDELESMSVREVKEAVEEARVPDGQISITDLIPEPAPEVTKTAGELEKEITERIEAQYAERINELESRAMSDDDLRNYCANAVKEAKAASTDEIKKLKADLKAAKDAKTTADNGRAEAEKAKQEAENKVKELEESGKEIAVLKAKVAAAEASKAEAERQIRLSDNPELARLKYMLEKWQNDTADLADQLTKCEPEKQEGIKAAIHRIIGRFFG